MENENLTGGGIDMSGVDTISSAVCAEDTLCCVCGHNMTHDGASTIGRSVYISSSVPNIEFERVESEFGKSEFHICWVCWLKSLGVKGKNR